MDYTDWSKETCIKTLKIASMQATLMLINSIIIIVTNYLAVLPIVCQMNVKKNVDFAKVS